MAGVRLEQVSRVYPGSVAAVDSLSLEVRDREFLVLVGPSGCGKSTTLRLIAGLESVSSGQVIIGGQVMNDVAPKDRDIAMVFQSYALYPHLSVYGNMAFGLQLRQGSSWWWRALCRVLRPAHYRQLAEKQQQIDRKVRDTARMLGIEPLLQRLPRQLSGGERQRVALGRAIVRQPAAFLFDEPLSNLDARLRVDMRRELKQLHRRLDATMIYVTHDQVEALTLGQRVAVLDRGKLQQVGTPQEVYSQPANRFVASFVGSPPMNQLEGEFAARDGQVEFRTAAGGLLVDNSCAALVKPYLGRSVVLGIRPEHLRLTPWPDESAKPSPAGGLQWIGRVQEVELLGDSFLVTVTLECTAVEAMDSRNRDVPAELVLAAKVPATLGVVSGQRVGVSWSSEQAHLFDCANGQNIGWSAPG